MQTQQPHSPSRALQPLLSPQELKALLLDELSATEDDDAPEGHLTPIGAAGAMAAAANPLHSV